MIGYVSKEDNYIAASTDNIDEIKCYEGTKIYLYDIEKTKIYHNGEWVNYISPSSGGGGGSGVIENGSIITEMFAENAKAPLAGVADSANAITSAKITDASTVGKSVLTATTAALARTAIGAGTGNGTSNLALGTTSTTAKAGDYQPTSNNITDATTVGKALIKATDAATARTAIGAGTGSSNLVIASTAPASLATAAAVGVGTTAARADHVHAFPTSANVGAAPTSHTHTIANVTGLQGAIDAKLTATKGVAVADSEATDVEALKVDFNALVSILRTNGFIATE